MNKLFPVPIPRLMAVTALALAFSGVAAGSAMAGGTASCTQPALSQPFLSYGDSNTYMLVPGQSGSGFNGTGWALSGGAKVSSGALDLPSGSTAVSPTICVTTEYPTARMMVRNVVGSEGVYFDVSYANTPSWNQPKNTGQVHGNGTAWTLSAPVNLQPPNVSGWQLVRFTFVPGGKSSDFQINDFYVDPFARH
jgi:hypothetical protein